MNPRIALFGYEVDAVRMPQAVATVMQWIDDGSGQCRYVVTPNVDHTVMYQERPDLRDAYADAGMILVDGMPVVLASKLLGKPVPERVTGTDLVYALFEEAAVSARVQQTQAADVPELVGAGVADGSSPLFASELESQWSDDTANEAASTPLRVFLLGAGPGVAERAAAKIEGRWQGVDVVGTYCPPMGFEKDPQENFEILRRIAAVQPDLLVVGLGAPKQELWVHRNRDQIRASVALCVGAAIDFLAEEKPRAPRWMQRCGLEWFHRLVSEPRRLAKRYARDAWIFPRLVWREWRTQRG